jgi:hypothetical protein
MNSKGSNDNRKGIAAWALKSYASLFTEYPRQKRAALGLVDGLPALPLDVTPPDSDTIYGWIEGLCATPHRRAGTPEGHRAEEYVAEMFARFGLEQITKEPIDMTVWDPHRWSLTVAGPPGDAVDIPCFGVVNTEFTAPEGVTAPMVYVPRPWLPGALRPKNVKGKIVVADVPFPTVPAGLLLKLIGGGYHISDPDESLGSKFKLKLIFLHPLFQGSFLDVDSGGARVALESLRLPWDIYWRSHENGALGAAFILSNMPTNSNTHFGPYDRQMKPMPALWVGKRDGVSLRSLAREGRTATLVLEGEKRQGVTHNVWGVLPGASERIIVVHSHHDSPFTGATEDGCGVGQVLAQARAWSSVPRQKRPKTMLFLCAAAHFHGPALGASEFVRMHREDLLPKVDVLLCLEHLGAREVVERAGEFAPTGRLAPTWIHTSSQEHVIAGLVRALRDHPLRSTVAIPCNLFAPVPTTDAFPYPYADMGLLSWISQPYYLLSAEDTLDKIEVSELSRIAETITGLVKTYMALESEKFRSRR